MKQIFARGGRIIESILSKTERPGIYTSLAREKTSLDTVDFETMKKNATTAVFSSQIRRKNFGGVV